MSSSITAKAAAVPSDLPPWALRMGYAGLLPFVTGALLVWLVREEAHPYVTLGLSAYAAVIVSFLGGIHWGLAMRQVQPPPALLVWGVVPSFPAWVAVMMPPSAGLVIHGLTLLVCYAVDRRVYPSQGVGHWLTLRFRLSAVAALSCFLGAAGT
ncbi:MAG: hypothetical protein RJA10_455 [Pseudomonadota bacterium]|jgi:hypothetical protein